MPASWIIEPVDIFKQGQFDLSSRLPGGAPDELSLEGFEEGLYNRIIITISFPTHGYQEAMFPEPFLIIVRAILTATIRVMNAAFGWLAKCHGHV